MKPLSILSPPVALTVIGCTANDKTAAGLEGSLNAPRPSAVSSDGRTQASAPADPGANGGSNLPPTAPYQGSAVSQNLNPAPFLAASQTQRSTSRGSVTQTSPASQTERVAHSKTR